jgi:hypothetical protein
MGPEIKSPSGNVPYCFLIHDLIYQLLSPLYPDEALSQDKDNFVSYYIESTTWIENQLTQVCMAEVTQ